jgi:NADH-quinone oxidoreductase subunit M
MLLTELHWTTHAEQPLLAAVQLLPALTALLMLVQRAAKPTLALALTAACIELALTVLLYSAYDSTSPSLQFAEHLSLPGPFDYHAAVDGVSILFMLLTALLSLLVLVYGPLRGLGPAWRMAAAVFAVEAALMACFATLNLLWFVLLSGLQVALIGYLLWRWATSQEKNFALTRFYQFMGTGMMLLLVGSLILGWNYSQSGDGGWSFDLLALQQVTVAPHLQSLTFFLLFYGLAIRIPLFPLHAWLPLVAEHGNIAVAPTLLLGLKLGVYGLLRFVFPLLPEAVIQWHGFIAAFAVVGIFYAALLAMLQNNLRRLLAFAAVSHTSILVLGLFSLERMALQASVLLSVTFGLALATLAFMSGLVFRRTQTTLLNELGGLFDHIPLIGIVFLIASLSIIGMPGTPGFDAVHLLLEASIQRFGGLVTIAAALGNVVAAGFLLWAFQRAFLAPRQDLAEAPPLAGITAAELLLAGLLLLVLLGAGFYTEPWLQLIDVPLTHLSALFAR